MENFDNFKSLLDEQITWPDIYTFKFVVQAHTKPELLTLLQEHKISEKESKTGKYISVSSSKLFHSSDDIVAVYKEVSKIEGIMTL